MSIFIRICCKDKVSFEGTRKLLEQKQLTFEKSGKYTLDVTYDSKVVSQWNREEYESLYANLLPEATNQFNIDLACSFVYDEDLIKSILKASGFGYYFYKAPLG